MLMFSHNRMVTFTEACPLDYHKTWDQLKRKCHKESLWAVSVMYDIYIERAVVEVLWHCGTVVLWYCGTVVLWYCGIYIYHQERKERLGWPELPAGALPVCGRWRLH